MIHNKQYNGMNIKKLAMTSFALLLCMGAVAQVKLPGKYVNDLAKDYDEFEKVTKFYVRGGGLLSIEVKDGKPTLYIDATCLTYETPVDLEKVIFLINEETIDIDYPNDDIQYYEKSVNQTRVSTSYGIGRSGSDINFNRVDRNACIYELKAEASKYQDIIDKVLASKKYQMRWKGRNQSIDYKGNKQEVERLKKLMKLYDELCEK